MWTSYRRLKHIFDDCFLTEYGHLDQRVTNVSTDWHFSVKTLISDGFISRCYFSYSIEWRKAKFPSLDRSASWLCHAIEPSMMWLLCKDPVGCPLADMQNIIFYLWRFNRYQYYGVNYKATRWECSLKHKCIVPRSAYIEQSELRKFLLDAGTNVCLFASNWLTTMTLIPPYAHAEIES